MVLFLHVSPQGPESILLQSTPYNATLHTLRGGFKTVPGQLSCKSGENSRFEGLLIKCPLNFAQQCTRPELLLRTGRRYSGCPAVLKMGIRWADRSGVDSRRGVSAGWLLVLSVVGDTRCSAWPLTLRLLRPWRCSLCSGPVPVGPPRRPLWSVSPPVTRETGVRIPAGEAVTHLVPFECLVHYDDEQKMAHGGIVPTTGVISNT